MGRVYDVPLGDKKDNEIITATARPPKSGAASSASETVRRPLIVLSDLRSDHEDEDTTMKIYADMDLQ